MQPGATQREFFGAGVVELFTVDLTSILQSRLWLRNVGIYNVRLPGDHEHKLFAGCQKKPAAIDMSEAINDPLAKIKQKLQDEIEALSHELNVELPKEIAVARAHGDLSENAEYKYAKERQGYVNARMGQLKKRLGDLGMLNLTNIPKDRSGYGSRIVVLDTQKDVKIEYKLVSSEEGDVEKGLISTTSPIGKALLNRKVGDEIEVTTPAGKKEFEVLKLVTIHDDI